jgi:DGQHR domain-containing protein
MSYKYNFIEFEQPLGSFLFATVPAEELLTFFEIKRRKYTKEKADGTQRELSDRVKDISNYCNTQDAAFPTSIIISLSKDQYKLDSANKIIEILGKAEIIDGQHRLEGLNEAYKQFGVDVIKRFTLPCVFIIEPTEQQKAFVFATINGKQTKVNKSLVYELFGISESPDPYNILHTLARTLNFTPNSPFYKRLKMLGKKSDDTNTESLTQGTFVDTLLGKITRDALKDRDLINQDKYDEIAKDSKLVLQDYLLNKKGELLVPLFINIFNAVSKTWPNEWEHHEDFILSKTTGYIGIMKGIDSFIRFGKENKVLTESYFIYIFGKLKEKLILEKLKFVSDDFPPGGKGENKLRDLLFDVYSEEFPIKDALLLKKLQEV